MRGIRRGLMAIHPKCFTVSFRSWWIRVINTLDECRGGRELDKWHQNAFPGPERRTAIGPGPKTKRRQLWVCWEMSASWVPDLPIRASWPRKEGRRPGSTRAEIKKKNFKGENEGEERKEENLNAIIPWLGAKPGSRTGRERIGEEEKNEPLELLPSLSINLNPTWNEIKRKIVKNQKEFVEHGDFLNRCLGGARTTWGGRLCWLCTVYTIALQQPHPKVTVFLFLILNRVNRWPCLLVHCERC